MKKVLLVVSLISVLLLAGCNKEEKIENNNVPDVIDNQQQEIIEKNDNVVYQDDINKYKLSSGYVLEDGSYEDIGFNSNSDKQYTFNSDNTEYIIRVEDTENGRKIYLNDQELIDIGWELDGIYDFNTEDDYKEIMMYTPGSINDSVSIYRVKRNNEIELLNEFNNLSLIKIGEKYIFPKYIEFIKEKVPYGYYEFNGDRFVYIDRLLNGEKLIDASETFRMEEFTTEWTADHAIGPGHFPIYENGEITEKYLANDSKIRILNLRLDANNNIDFADIELVSNSIISEGRMGSDDIKETPIEAGTKLTIKFIPAG